MNEPRDEEWEIQHLYVLYYSNADGLGLCGCGVPDAAYNLVRDLVNLAPYFQDDGWRKAEQLIGTDGAVHIVLGQLDRVGLIEHGGVITGSWLTGKGRYVRYLINRHDWDDVDEYGFPHDGQDCEPGCWVAPAGLDLSGPAPAERRAATPPRSGNPFTECRLVDQTWIHAASHTCPVHARGRR